MQLEPLHQAITSQNLRQIRSILSTLTPEHVHSASFSSLSFLPALVGLLSLSVTDIGLAETTLSLLASLPRRISISNKSTLPLAMLLHSQGISFLLMIAREFWKNNRIVALSVVILRNLCLEDSGVRLVVMNGGVRFLLDVIRGGEREKEMGSLVLGVVLSMILGNLNARDEVLGVSGIMELLVGTATRGGDAKELGLSVLGILTTERTGARLGLKGKVDVGTMALEFISTVAGKPVVAGMGTPPPKNANVGDVLMTALMDRVRSPPSSNNPMSSPASTTTPVSGTNNTTPGTSSVGVVARERRACAWALMLLHNLWLYAEDDNVRNELRRSTGLKIGGSSTFQDREIARRALCGVALSPPSMETPVVVLDNNKATTVKHDDDDDPEQLDHESKRSPPPVPAREVQKYDISPETKLVADYVLCRGPHAEAADTLTTTATFNAELPMLAVLFSSAWLQVAHEVRPIDLIRAMRGAIDAEATASPGTQPLPASRAVCSAITFVHIALSHPWLRSRYLNECEEEISMFIQQIRKESDPPEYFSSVVRSLELALGSGSREIPFIPERRFVSDDVMPPLPPQTPQKQQQQQGKKTSPPASPAPSTTPIVTTPQSQPLDLLTGASPVVVTPVNGIIKGDENNVPPPNSLDLLTWRSSHRQLVKQLTLRMERMYFHVDPCAIMLFATGLASVDAPLLACLEMHENLVSLFQEQILAQELPSQRALVVQCIVEIAAYSASTTISNLDLTMACLRALASRPVARLEQTWRVVDSTTFETFTELMRLSHFMNLEENGSVDEPPPLLRIPGVPYFRGCVRHLSLVFAQQQEEEEHQYSSMKLASFLEKMYKALSLWIPCIGQNGDWLSRPQAFLPIHEVQMATKDLAQNYARPRLENLMRASLDREPMWSQILAVERCACVLESLVEQAVELEAKNVRITTTSTVADAGRVVDVLFVDVWEKNRRQFLDRAGLLRTSSSPLLASASAATSGLILPERTTSHDEQSLDALTIRVRCTIERAVIGPVWSRLWTQILESHSEKEIELSRRLAVLRLSDPSRVASVVGLDVNSRLVEESRWKSAVETLTSGISAASTSPTAQLRLLLRVKDRIFQEASEAGLTEMSADDFLPVLSLVILRASVAWPCPWSTLCFIKEFFGPDRLSTGEDSYFAVSLEVALTNFLRHNVQL